MTFSSPALLWGLLALIPILSIQLRAYFKGKGDLAVLGRHWESDTAQTVFLVKWFFTVLTFDLFIACSVIALSGPSWGERPIEEDRENLDVIVALDISRSMLGDDIEPSRLIRSLSLVRSISRQLPSARFGLVGFKGDAVILLPLTEDLNALEAVLDGISHHLVSTPGTDLGRGLRRAIDGFPPGTNAHRAILLMSDGESLSGSPGEAASEARSLGIPVLTVIAGTLEGSTLPAGDGSLITDTDGRPVVSKAVPGALEAISELTGSDTVWLDDVDVGGVIVEKLLAHVLKQVALLSLGLCLAILVTGCGGSGAVLDVIRGNLSYSRGDYQNALVHYMVALEDKPSDSWTRFNIGNVYYALGEHEAALEMWHDARSEAETTNDTGNWELSLIYATSYNRGVLLFQQGSYEAAYDEFRYALTVNGRSTDAKANLEIALGKLQAAQAASAGQTAESGAGTAGGGSSAPLDDQTGDGPGEQTLRILEYVRRKETQQWFANREIESHDQPQDW